MGGWCNFFLTLGFVFFFRPWRCILNALLNKALYGTVQAFLLFWNQLSDILLKNHGFVRNEYDWCVANKAIIGTQAAVAWYVDD
jgi:hypothetical protein